MGGDTWPLQDVYNGIICPWDNARLVWEYRTGEGEDSFQVDSSITVECV